MQCRKNAQCGAWTWGSMRNVPDISDFCFLKKVGEKGVKKNPKEGVISGLRIADSCPEAKPERPHGVVNTPAGALNLDDFNPANDQFLPGIKKKAVQMKKEKNKAAAVQWTYNTPKEKGCTYIWHKGPDGNPVAPNVHDAE